VALAEGRDSKKMPEGVVGHRVYTAELMLLDTSSGQPAAADWDTRAPM
jgi:hypothetical protein